MAETKKRKTVSKKPTTKVKTAKKTGLKKSDKSVESKVKEVKKSSVGTVKKTVSETPKKSEKKVAEPKKSKIKTPRTMEELLEVTGYKLKAPKRGDVVEGIVTDVTKRMVLVDIGGKTEGMVVDKEFDATKDLIGGLTVGDTVSVYVSSPENDRGQILLSLKKAAVDKKWVQFDEFLKTGEITDVVGLEVNRGGLIVQTEGMRGFVPSSQFGKAYLGSMDQLLDKSFKVKVIEVDREKNRLIFSERLVSEAEAIDKKDRALKVIKVDDEFEGIVSGIMPFGVFMTVTVPLNSSKVAKLQGGKVAKSKSSKATKSQGGKVKKKTDDDSVGQVEGLVHISEISWEKVNDPNDYFKQGDKAKVRVLGVENGKLNLSIKQISDDPWSSVAKKYAQGKQVKGKVTRAAPFGVFVTLEPGVDGLIHISKIPAGSEPKVGEPIDVVVDSVDPESRRMSLGMVLTEVPVSYR